MTAKNCFRFRLQSLFTIVLVSALVFGWWSDHRRLQRYLQTETLTRTNLQSLLTNAQRKLEYLTNQIQIGPAWEQDRTDKEHLIKRMVRSLNANDTEQFDAIARLEWMYFTPANIRVRNHVVRAEDGSELEAVVLHYEAMSAAPQYDYTVVMLVRANRAVACLLRQGNDQTPQQLAVFQDFDEDGTVELVIHPWGIGMGGSDDPPPVQRNAPAGAPLPEIFSISSAGFIPKADDTSAAGR